MIKFRDILSIVLLICIGVVFFILFAILNGITTFNGILQVTAILLAVFVLEVVLVYVIGNRFSFEKASERELRAEDDILLQATAFSQAALWIFLNLIPSDGITFFFKWLVPSVAILFYCLRAYGKLKDNNKYRYRSMLVFSFVIGFSIAVLTQVLIAPFWKGLLIIDGMDLTANLVTPAIFGVPLLLSILFYKELRIRYGLT